MIDFPIPFSGAIFVTGPKSVGKTTLCITVTDPKRICVLDYDNSAQGFHDQLGFGRYHNMLAESGSGVITSGVEVYKYTMAVIGGLKKGQYDAIVVDNIIPIEAALSAHIDTYPSQYGLTAGQMQKMAGLKWGPFKASYRSLLSSLLEVSQLVFVTAHLKQPWAGSQPVPGLYVPRGNEVLREACSLGLWLQPGTVPSALVLYSRLTKFTLTNGRPKPTRVLPPRMPEATWDSIHAYMSTPYDPLHPKPGEVPNADEMHKLRGTVSREQMDFMNMAMREAVVKGNGNDEEPPMKEVVSVSLSDFVSVVMNAGADMGKAMETLGVKAITEIRDYGEALEKLGL